MRGGHAQTLYAALFAPRPPVSYQRERWETPDGDFIDLDWVSGSRESPLLVLFHGLESGSGGHYARALAAACRQRGWRFVVPHFRGCSGEPNRLARAYHAGDSAEIAWILERLTRGRSAPCLAVGVSLGGNALLKYLGERGTAAGDVLDGAAAVCAPMELAVAGEVLGVGLNRVYTWHFLRSLKPRAVARLQRHPGIYDLAALRRARNLRGFDDAVTAPLHGFAGVDDYWQRASSKPLLGNITLPTLLLNSRDDPFYPAAALPDPAALPSCVQAEYPESGGHVGFVSGAFPGNLDWLPMRLLGFFDEQL
ncbi:YheT family hydrolase [Thermithiobacillus plumbiphilus]|uniref:Alpha/beta fold hydrolase n=1 Tax=Thermithiobacillus plumbiphilus TaxID=1729899 RepID=A0ABU9D8L8_9PROT